MPSSSLLKSTSPQISRLCPIGGSWSTMFGLLIYPIYIGLGKFPVVGGCVISMADNKEPSRTESCTQRENKTQQKYYSSIDQAPCRNITSTLYWPSPSSVKRCVIVITMPQSFTLDGEGRYSVDVILRHGAGSIFAQIMDWWLTAPR